MLHPVNATRTQFRPPRDTCSWRFPACAKVFICSGTSLGTRQGSGPWLLRRYRHNLKSTDSEPYHIYDNMNVSDRFYCTETSYSTQNCGMTALMMKRMRFASITYMLALLLT